MLRPMRSKAKRRRAAGGTPNEDRHSLRGWPAKRRPAGAEGAGAAHRSRRASRNPPEGKKPELIANRASTTQALLDSGCCRVLIVWDVQPRWGRPDGAIQDSKDIRQKLGPHGLANHPCVFLVPIKAELEAWLLADGRALSQVLSRPEH